MKQAIAVAALALLAAAFALEGAFYAALAVPQDTSASRSEARGKTRAWREATSEASGSRTQTVALEEGPGGVP